jgi:hypothetical protein
MNLATPLSILNSLQAILILQIFQIIKKFQKIFLIYLISIPVVVSRLNPTPSKVIKIINNTKVESKMTPMHAQSIFIYIYIKIHGSQK